MATAIGIADLDNGREVEKARILARTAVGDNDACWFWLGPVNPEGYGNLHVRIRGAWRMMRVHRLMFLVDQGYLPAAGRDIAHRCGHSLCVNPACLYDASKKENMADRDRHGTTARGDRHYARQQPDKLPRGDRNGSRTHPEARPRGESHYKARLSAEQVREMRRLRATGLSCRLIAAQFDVPRSTATTAIYGRSWRRLD